MKQYIYYNKRDSSKEPQGKVQADNITEAIEKAAAIKQMDLDSFLSIFDVKPNGNREIQKLI
jgi:DNA-directed RNA polymerase subunit F